MSTFERTLELPVDRVALFDWHERPGAFERLSPSWERLEIIERSGGIRDGGFMRMNMRRGPLRIELPGGWVVHLDHGAAFLRELGASQGGGTAG